MCATSIDKPGSNQGTNNQGANDQGANNQGANNQGANNQGANNQGANNEGANDRGASIGAGNSDTASSGPGDLFDPFKPAAGVSASQPQPLPAAPIITLAGEVFTRDSVYGYVAGSATIIAGAPGINIDGMIVSLASSEGDSSIFLFTTPPAPTPTQPPDRFTAAGFTIHRDPFLNLVIGDRTITPDETAVTISGTPIRALASGTALVIGDSTIPLPAHVTAPVSPNIFTIPGVATLTRAHGLDLQAGTQTIRPGAPAITISGTPVSLLPAGTAIVVGGGSTIPIANNSPSSTQQPSILEINGYRFTETSGSSFVLGSQTIVPGGPAITLNGTRISLAPAASALQVGSSTVARSSTERGLGDIVMSGFFSGVPGPTGPTNGSFTGGGAVCRGLRQGVVFRLCYGVLVACLFALR